MKICTCRVCKRMFNVAYKEPVTARQHRDFICKTCLKKGNYLQTVISHQSLYEGEIKQ